MTNSKDTLLKIENLGVHFEVGSRVAKAVGGISFDIKRGETVGLVGESGCGKSVSSLATMGLIPSPPGKIVSGSIEFENTNLLNLSNSEMRKIRGNDISMIFQEPMTSLNPVFTIGNQITEAILCHENIPASTAYERAADMLREVGIPNPELTLSNYPHELSGGMKQRAMIAMALVCNPKLVICDEPTTALDVTIQAQILDLLRRLQKEHDMSLLFITHDLGVIAELAHRVCVMYAGRIAEKAEAAALFSKPLHPYTIGLFKSLPSLSGERKKLFTIPGQVPNPVNFPEGCRFHPRCDRAKDICRTTVPELEEKQPGRWCACHDVPKEI